MRTILFAVVSLALVLPGAAWAAQRVVMYEHFTQDG